MIKFQNLTKYPDDRVQQALGLIPQFLSEDNPGSAKTQFHNNYRHGGGWSPMKGFTFNKESLTLSYPGDPPMRAYAMAMLRAEIIYIFDHAWVLIWQSNGDWEVARMD